jgi:Carboxypeptidase regulatory-like domain
MPMFLRSSLLILISALALAQHPAANPAANKNAFEIRGILLDAVTLQPLAKATVAIAPVTSRSDFREFITADDGRFYFSSLPAGKYTLTARRRGYLPQALNQHEGFSSAVVVGPPIESSNIMFRLPPESAISGTVLDEAGEPVRDAQVMLFQTGLVGGRHFTRRVGQTTTDDQGVYRFGHLPPRQFVVAVSARVWYAQRPQPGRETVRMVVTDGGASTTATYGMVGKVSSGHSDTATSDVDSQTDPLDVVYPITFYAGTTEPSTASPIALKPGEKYVADISLQPVPALHLRFPADSGGTQGQNRFVTLEEKLSDGIALPILAETRTTASGAMELVGVPPGHYTATVRQFPTVQQAGAGNAGAELQPQVEELDAVNSGEVQAAHVSGAQLSVSLQLDPGSTRPTQGYLQLLNMNTRDYYNELVTEKGDVVFKQPIPPGTYELALTNGRGEFIRAISALGAQVSGRTVQIREARTVKLGISIGHGMGQVTGTVLRSGKPFAGAMVVLVPADPGNKAILFRRDQSDSDGTFTLAGAIPGKYTVVAIENGWDLEWLNPDVIKAYLAKGVPLEVMPNGKYDVTVNLQR